MLSIVLTWRRNLLLSLFAVLFIGSFQSQSRDLCAAWWVAQKHSSGTSFFQVVRHEESLPSWYIHLHSIIEFWKAKLNNELMLNLMFCMVKLAGMLWVNLFLKVITIMIKKGTEPSALHWNCSGIIEQNIVEIRLQATTERIESPAEIGSPVSQNEIIEILSYEKTEIPGFDNTVNFADVNYLKLPEPDISNGKPAEFSPKRKIYYEHDIEQLMKRVYNSLSEKDKRRYAGIEALKIGHGGRSYIADLFECDRKTVRRGIKEISEMPADIKFDSRIRAPGGGRKPYWLVQNESLDRIFLDAVKTNTAGDPMNKDILWTNLSHEKISGLLAGIHNVTVSTKIVRQLLEGHKFHRRKAQKKQTRKTVKNRNAQFENIAGYITDYTQTGDPVFSMDTKKKEFLGLFRNGHLYTQSTIIVPDHDFPSYSDGIVIPHSLWDVKRNKGYITLGTSKDTSEFACDSIRNWWYNHGRKDYPHSGRILLLCDGGGSNSSRSHIFKQDMQRLTDETGLEIRIAHYPPYTSKYNPIEHRMFPHVTKACEGVIFESYEHVKKLMEKTETKTGLTVTVRINRKEYKTRRKADKNFIENNEIVFDDHLPRWNYRVIPTN
ncbi:ISAzo13 family transposase [Desulfococcaceae bacterium HSG8]|nr:ISAzo13 family transposase [Desulfococcaceae bacterium HSG8]